MSQRSSISIGFYSISGSTPRVEEATVFFCVCLFVLGLLLFLPIFAFDHFGRVGISALSLSNDVRFSIERDAALHVADSHKEHANNAKGNNAFQSSGVQQNLTEMISLSGISQSGIIHQQVWAKEILMPMEAS